MASRSASVPSAQSELPLLTPTEANQNLPEAFKRIYYHLYTNSKASRAEAIIEDLSLLLLCKLASDHEGNDASIVKFLNGKGEANEMLLPLLQRTFPDLLGKGQQFSLGDVSLRLALAEMQGMDLTHAPAHLIGEAFQALMGPRLRGEKGQFFTPKSVVRAMVEILRPGPNESVLDPASGTGGFLAETYLYQSKNYDKKEIRGRLVGVDKDAGLSRLAGALLTVLANDRSHVHNFNSLDFAEWVEYFGSMPEAQFDVVLTNPPFGSKIGVKEDRILKNYAFGHIWTTAKKEGWTQTAALSVSEDPQVLFLELCVRALKPGGRMGIVLPEGMFGNKQTAYIWTWLKEQGIIFGLLDCPRTTFQPGTDTKTNVLFFKKNMESGPDLTTKTKVAVAIHCGHDRRGRSVKATGEVHQDDFSTIATSFSEQTSTGVWREVALAKADYLVPRYHYYKADKIKEETGAAAGAKLVTLAELVKKGMITIRKGHEVGSDAYGTGDIPFVRTSDISNFEISADPTKSISEQIYDQYSSQQSLRAGDILMVVDGRYRIGATAMLDEHSVKCVAQSHLRIISVNNQSLLDPYGLLYALNLPSVKMRMRGLVFIQSTLGTLGSRLMELKVPLLVGEGPWTQRVTAFKDTLRQRSKLLSDMKQMAGPEIEL